MNNKQNIFILNPISGRRNWNEPLLNTINTLSKKYRITTVVTQHNGHATEIAEQKARLFANEEINMFACGGDGTLNEVVNGVYKYPNVSVGCIPYGSGNNFVRSFEQFSLSDFRNVENMINGSTVPVDLMFTDHCVGINMMTCGFDCDVVMSAEKLDRLPFVWGRAAYDIAVFYRLLHNRHRAFTIIADDKIICKNGKTQLALAANGKYYGGGGKFAPNADSSDGLMDIVYVPAINRRTFLALAGSFKKGEYLSNPKAGIIKCTRCQKLQIKSDKPVQLNIDGEIEGFNNPVITIKKSALNFILPARTVPVMGSDKVFAQKNVKVKGSTATASESLNTACKR